MRVNSKLNSQDKTCASAKHSNLMQPSRDLTVLARAISHLETWPTLCGKFLIIVTNALFEFMISDNGIDKVSDMCCRHLIRFFDSTGEGRL